MFIKTSHILGCVAIAAAVAGVANAAPITLLNDTFSDNERATQSLTTSAAWYLRTASATLPSGYSAAGGNLDLPYVNPSAAHTQVAYFTASGSPISLADGDSISVSADVTLDQLTNSADIFRVGFFNSFAGARVAADDDGANTTTDGYKGYAARFNGSTGLTTFQGRSNTNTNAQLFGGNSLPTYAATAGAAGSAVAAGTPFSVTFTMTRSGANLNLASSYNGQTYTATANSGFTLDFDTLAFFGGTNLTQYTAASGQGLTLDNVVVTYTAVPEPTSLIAVAGLAGLGLVRRRRA